MRTAFLFMMVSVLMGSQATGQSENSQIRTVEERADSLYDHFKEYQALAAYQDLLEADPDHYRALWRASFLYSRIGYRLSNEQQQLQYFNKAIDLAEQALEVDSTDSQSNFVMAVAEGRKALISKAKRRVAASRKIKKYVTRAIEFDSTNAGAWHVLGRWHFEIANLNFAERLAANVLFGGVPKGASNEKAKESIERAVNLKPNYIPYRYDLARVYEKMGERQKAVESCRVAINLNNLTPDDPEIKEKCQELMDNLQ